MCLVPPFYFSALPSCTHEVLLCPCQLQLRSFSPFQGFLPRADPLPWTHPRICINTLWLELQEIMSFQFSGFQKVNEHGTGSRCIIFLSFLSPRQTIQNDGWYENPLSITAEHLLSHGSTGLGAIGQIEDFPST